MHITNQKLRFDIFTEGNLQNIHNVQFGGSSYVYSR